MQTIHQIYFQNASEIYFLGFYNPRQNIWSKVRESSKTGQDQKTLTSAFVYFFTAITKVLFIEGGDWTVDCVFTQI